MIIGNLLNLSVNMWSDVPIEPGRRRVRGNARYVDYLYFDQSLWDELTERMAGSGFTMVVIDLGDGVRYDSHPEIAVRGAWSTQRLRDELARLRQLGLEPIPKLNFSAAHDAWLGDYGRMVSTDRYYQVCGDLIAEVAELFDQPRFLHLGMDEEDAAHQARHQQVVVRQGDLWWNDLRFLADRVEQAGSRPWVWSDPAWGSPGQYYARMPKSILQSNWYYGLWFEAAEENRPRMLRQGEQHLTYLDLDEHGYEQIATASTWQNRWDNFAMTVDFCTSRLAQERLLGFLQTSWLMTVPEHRDEHLRTIDVAARAIENFRTSGRAVTHGEWT